MYYYLKLVDERDIYYLYIKFKKLEPNGNWLISNSQLLELPEFRFCPFRGHLIRVFKLEQDFNIGANEDGNNIYLYDDPLNNKINKNNNFINSIDRSQRRGSYVRSNISIGRQYINFKKFCEIMKVFSYRASTELKIKCKIK